MNHFQPHPPPVKTNETNRIPENKEALPSKSDTAPLESFESFTGEKHIPSDGDVNIATAPSSEPRSSQSLLSDYPTFFPTTLIIFSSILFSGMQICVRHATSRHHLSISLLVFSRAIFQFFMSGSLILFLGIKTLTSTLSSRSVLTLALRGILGALSMVFKFATLSHLPVAVASALFATSPIFATIFGYIFIGERMTFRDALALFVTTIGAGLLGIHTLPGIQRDIHTNGVGVVLGLCTANLIGATFVSIRKLGSKVHFLWSVFALSIGGMAAPIFLQFIGSQHSLGAEIAGLGIEKAEALVRVGIFAFGGAVCLNRGLQMTTAGRAAMLRACDIPINFVFAAITLGEVPSEITQLAGCGVIALNACNLACAKRSVR